MRLERACGLVMITNLMESFSTQSVPLTTVSLIQWPYLTTIQTFNVHTTGLASCVELAMIITVWYWALLTAGSAPTAILPCSFLLQ